MSLRMDSVRIVSHRNVGVHGLNLLGIYQKQFAWLWNWDHEEMLMKLWAEPVLLRAEAYFQLEFEAFLLGCGGYELAHPQMR